MSKISQIEFLAAVVEEGSFTGAADALDVSKSHVSNQISRLEDRLGVRLLQRTTRSVDPTSEGQAYYEQVRQILDDLENAERALRQAQSEPMGRLRVTAPVSLGTKYLGDVAGQFLQQYENVSLDLDLLDRKVSLVDEGYDLAVRVGQLEDSRLIVRKIADVSGCVAASPAYLKKHGEPDHPDELTDHNCLVYSYLNTGPQWQFTAPEEIDVPIDGSLESNNGTVLVDAASQGEGIALAPAFLVADALREGKLRRIFPEWSLGVGGVWALYPHRRHLSAKVPAFIDVLKQTFSPPPWEKLLQ